LVRWLSLPMRYVYTLQTGDTNNLRHQQTLRAETRQSLSSLSLFGYRPSVVYRGFPQDVTAIDRYLEQLDWSRPWGAGSHFSHLLFFLANTDLPGATALFDHATAWVMRLQHAEDGCWYRGAPPLSQKINGAMKILTGLQAADRLSVDHPRALIDSALQATNDAHACDNFNVTYVLAKAAQATQRSYRMDDIRDFMYNRLELYRQYYYPSLGGFSFKKGKANRFYYGALLSRGKSEPDIHGTVLFGWGLALVASALGEEASWHLYEYTT